MYFHHFKAIKLITKFEEFGGGTAVVGFNEEIKGECPLAFVLLRKEMDVATMSAEEKDKIAKELNNAVRTDVGAFASLVGVILMEKLPKTKSGKILRGTMRKIAQDQEYGYPATIDDTTALDHVHEKIAEWKTHRAAQMK